MTQNGISSSSIDSIINKTWSIRDQKSVFAINFVANNSSVANLVEPLISTLGYNKNTLKPGLIIEGYDITESILNQSLEYFQKALYNFNSHYLLAYKGYNTWASVTNYYSSYFSIFSLLLLQGRVITRIKLDGVKDIPCIIHPLDFKNHQYILTTKETGEATHKLPWKKYYTIYDKYPNFRSEFEVIQSLRFVTESIDESEERNRINYKIFEGFQEVLNLNELATFQQLYSSILSTPELGQPVDNYIIALNSLATDPIFKYFARSALRLILIRALFKEIIDVNSNFGAEFNRRIPILQASLFDSYNPPSNYYENFINIFLN